MRREVNAKRYIKLEAILFLQFQRVRESFKYNNGRVQLKTEHRARAGSMSANRCVTCWWWLRKNFQLYRSWVGGSSVRWCQASPQQRNNHPCSQGRTWTWTGLSKTWSSFQLKLGVAPLLQSLLSLPDMMLDSSPCLSLDGFSREAVTSLLTFIYRGTVGQSGNIQSRSYQIFLQSSSWGRESTPSFSNSAAPSGLEQ